MPEARIDGAAPPRRRPHKPLPTYAANCITISPAASTPAASTRRPPAPSPSTRPPVSAAHTTAVSRSADTLATASRLNAYSADPNDSTDRAPAAAPYRQRAASAARNASRRSSSRHLNTELGFVMDSPALAQRMREGTAGFLPANTYRVELGADGALRWRERDGDREVVHAVEPGTTWWKRAAIGVLSYLPIEWLL